MHDVCARYLGHPCNPPCLLHAHHTLSNPVIRVRKRRRAHFGLDEVLQLGRGRLELVYTRRTSALQWMDQ